MSYNVRDYGVKADGGTDDAPAIQKAIDAAVAGTGGEVVIPAGGYLLKSGLSVANVPPTKAIRLVGEGQASLLYFQRDVAPAAVAEAIRIENASGSGVAGLNLFCQGAGFTHGLHVTARPVGGSNGSTESVTIERVTAAGFPVGLAVGADTDNDVSEVSFYDCLGTGTVAGFLLGNGTVSNVINVRMFGCQARESGCGVKALGCNFTWYGGTAQHNSVADFYVYGPNTAPVVIDGVRSESSKRFFMQYGSVQFAMPTSVRSCYVSAWTDPDGIVVENQANAPLTIADCVFAMAPTPAKFNFGVGTPGAQPAAVTLSNVGVNGPTPLVTYPSPVVRLCNHGVYQVDNANGGVMAPCAYPTPGQPAATATGSGTIPRGQTTVTVLHGLPSPPAWEDVRVMSSGSQAVWLSGLNAKSLAFRADQKAPPAGVPFQWSACTR